MFGMGPAGVRPAWRCVRVLGAGGLGPGDALAGARGGRSRSRLLRGPGKQLSLSPRPLFEGGGPRLLRRLLRADRLLRRSPGSTAFFTEGGDEDGAPRPLREMPLSLGLPPPLRPKAAVCAYSPRARARARLTPAARRSWDRSRRSARPTSARPFRAARPWLPSPPAWPAPASSGPRRGRVPRAPA